MAQPGAILSILVINSTLFARGVSCIGFPVRLGFFNDLVQGEFLHSAHLTPLNVRLYVEEF